MDGLNFLVPITAILVGGAIVLLPLAALTARFALKPLVEAFARARGGEQAVERLALVEQRLALVEEQLHGLERDNARLLEEADFRRQLERGRA
jgi:hypothetical protein